MVRPEATARANSSLLETIGCAPRVFGVSQQIDLVQALGMVQSVSAGGNHVAYISQPTETAMLIEETVASA